MNDKELLMMAAKAAGIRGEWSEACGKFEKFGDEGWHTGFFEPLTDDGEALRLAVKLSLSIFYSEQFVEINFDDESGKVDFFSVIEFFPPDDFEMKMAATMLAITRAAAEIGSKL